MLTINPDLKSLIPALTADEYQQLEANLLAEGCNDPLIVWQETTTLLDGHHRLRICQHHGLRYRLATVSLPDLDAAKAWMIAHQLGRRNLTPEQISYFRGKQYEIQKQQGKRTDLTSGNSYQKLPNTATQLASQHQVSEKTIRNDAAFAKAVQRFLSLEPLLAPLAPLDLTGISWVIVGGESGPGSRPMPHAWVWPILEACQRHDVAFFFKQSAAARPGTGTALQHADGTFWEHHEWPDERHAPIAVEAPAVAEPA
jgi:hypothetical protein